MRTRRTLTFNIEANERAGRAARVTHLFERLLANERLASIILILIERDGEIEARRKGSHLFAQFVSIERHARFESQRVAGAEAHWPQWVVV